MYQPKFQQLAFEKFHLPFGGKLDPQNCWVKLAELIPWHVTEKMYAMNFPSKRGALALTVRMALGALIIKEKLGLSDIETVEQIKEGPYLQYFIGLESFQYEAPFDASMLTHFRKRLKHTDLGALQEELLQRHLAEERKRAEEKKVNNDGNDGPVSTLASGPAGDRCSRISTSPFGYPPEPSRQEFRLQGFGVCCCPTLEQLLSVQKEIFFGIDDPQTNTFEKSTRLRSEFSFVRLVFLYPDKDRELPDKSIPDRVDELNPGNAQSFRGFRWDISGREHKRLRSLFLVWHPCDLSQAGLRRQDASGCAPF